MIVNVCIVVSIREVMQLPVSGQHAVLRGFEYHVRSITTSSTLWADDEKIRKGALKDLRQVLWWLYMRRWHVEIAAVRSALSPEEAFASNDYDDDMPATPEGCLQMHSELYRTYVTQMEYIDKMPERFPATTYRRRRGQELAPESHDLYTDPQKKKKLIVA